MPTSRHYWKRYHLSVRCCCAGGKNKRRKKPMRTKRLKAVQQSNNLYCIVICKGSPKGRLLEVYGHCGNLSSDCQWMKVNTALTLETPKANYYSAASNNTKLVHWPLMGGLLHLVHGGAAWAGCGPAQSPPRCTKCNGPPNYGQCVAITVSQYSTVVLTVVRVMIAMYRK